MRLFNIKDAHHGQRGFTILELLVGIAITGLIAIGLATSIFQIMNGNDSNTKRNTVIRQVQNAGYWMSRDAQMAQIVDITGDRAAEVGNDYPVGSGFPLYLKWVDWAGTTYEVVYSLVDSSDGLQLIREYSTDGFITTLTNPIASYILSNPSATSVTYSSKIIILTVTAEIADYPNEVSETREYRIVPRTT